MKGVDEAMLSSYLDVFMWHECHSAAVQTLCHVLTIVLISTSDEEFFKSNFLPFETFIN